MLLCLGTEGETEEGNRSVAQARGEEGGGGRSRVSEPLVHVDATFSMMGFR